jgi:allantoinase
MTKLVKHGQVWVDGEFRQVDLLIDAQGRIASIENSIATPDREYERVYDAANCLVLPGGIDAHAHIQDGAETFYQGSCAAAVGGITTVIDMPPFHVCSTPVGLKARMTLADEACVVDFSTHGGIVVEPADLIEMDGVASAGAAGFKVFMPAQPPVSREVLWGAVQTAARTGLRLVIHAEEPACLLTEVNWADPLGFANARPPVAETAATAFVLEMAQAAGAPVHICHVSAGRTAELINHYRSRGVDVTAETTPHFLLFHTADFHRLGARLKTTPPLREVCDTEMLWQALAEGVIDMVVSDHYLGELPNKDAEVSFEDKGAGIAGLEVSLPLLYHTGVVEKRLTVERFIQVIAENPARIFGFDGRKGKIAPGFDADLVILNPEEEWIVKSVGDFSRAAGLPYEGWRFQGKINSTLVRGMEVWNGESIQVEKGTGKFIARKP